MIFDKKSETHHPTVQQSRNSRWSSFAEVFFGAVAKATMVVAAVIVIILTVLSWGAGLTDIPTSRKEFRVFLLMLLVVVIGTVLGIYFHWFPA